MDKKSAKKERKRKKLAALLNVMELNERDKRRKTSSNPIEENAVKDFSRETLEEIKSRLKVKEKLKMTKPLLFLTDPGLMAQVNTDPKERIPIFLNDIQNLLLYSVIGDKAPFKPRWCNLVRWTRATSKVVILIEGLSLKDIECCSQELKFPSLFQNKLEFVRSYVTDVLFQLCAVPVSTRMKQKLFTKHQNMGRMKEMEKLFSIEKYSIKPKNDEVIKSVSLNSPDTFPRTELLLSLSQMIEENYPLPFQGHLGDHVRHFVPTKTEYAEVNESSPMFGVDCEMCRTAEGSELTSVAIVNEKHELVYHKLVKPRNKIIDYLTPYSGITPAMLKDVTTRIEDVQNDISELLPKDAILVGQSLCSDLRALQMLHPYVIDTAVIYNLTGSRNRKSKLAYLMDLFLKESIQTSVEGHDPIEDSSAALKLVQLKLKFDPTFGDSVLQGYIPSWDEDVLSAPINFKSPEEEKEYNKIQLLSSILRYTCEQGKTVKYIGNLECLKPEVKKLLATVEHEELMKLSPTNDESDVFKVAYDEPYLDDLIFIHWQSKDMLGVDNTLRYLDRNIQHLHDKLPSNALMFLIVAGVSGPKGLENGVCFVKIKE